MINGRIIKYSDGREVKIEVLFTFKVEELGNEYVAYLLNDDGKSEETEVYISEIIKDENSKLLVKEIPDNEMEVVMTMYEECKKTIME